MRVRGPCRIAWKDVVGSCMYCGDGGSGNVGTCIVFR